jgi:dihydroflavonol-4-reductase
MKPKDISKPKVKSTVAVLGGTGLIGWHTALALKAAGHGVRVLARKPPLEALGFSPDEFRSIDLFNANESELETALLDCTALVQAAGADPRIVPKGSARDYFFEVNVAANDRLLAAAQSAGLRTVVLLTSYFHPLRPEMASHPYVASRIASEKAALALQSSDFRVVILQPPYVFGAIPGRTSLGDSIAKLSWLPMLLPGGGTNAIAVGDLAQAILGAVERPVQGTFLVGDENLTNKALFKRFGGRSLRLPTFLLKGFMWCARAFLNLRGKESGLDPVKLADALVTELFFDPGPSQKALDYAGGGLDAAILEIKGKE